MGATAELPHSDGRGGGRAGGHSDGHEVWRAGGHSDGHKVWRAGATAELPHSDGRGGGHPGGHEGWPAGGRGDGHSGTTAELPHSDGRAGGHPGGHAGGHPGGLAVRGAVVRYGPAESGTTAVAGVDLDVADGEILALLGPSGCGKSSLLRAVAGLEPLAAGSVTFAGLDLDGVPVHRRGFGLLFQDGQLFPHRDVARNVAYGLETLRVPRAERAARVRALLDAVGLGTYERRPVATLSGGERQRVALARALAPRPRLLLLDEPFSALDRALRERLSVEVRDVLKATGTTAIFVTHDDDEAFTVADRVGVMSAGRLLRVAPPEDLWRAPGTRTVAEFLGYQAFLPRPGGQWLAIGPTGLRVIPGDDGGAVDGAAADGGAADGGAVAPADDTAAWVATVRSSAFRRGRTEVTVEADLGGDHTTLVALADGVAAALTPGTGVRVALDPAGCAVVGD